MPECEGEIFALKFFEGSTFQEIAKELKMSRSTVQNRLKSAVRKLRAKLGEWGYAD